MQLNYAGKPCLRSVVDFTRILTMSIQLFCQGNRSFKDDNFNQAVEAYQQAIALNPNCYFFYHNLGEAFAKMGKLEEAVDAFRHALKLKPSSDFTHFQLGQTLQQLGQINDEVNEIDFDLDVKALSTEENSLISNSRLDIQSISPAPNRSIETIDNTQNLPISPANLQEPLHWTKEELEDLVRQGNYDQVIALCDRILMAEPQNFYVYHKLGIAWENKGILEKAQNCYQTAVTINPDFDKGYHNLGNTLTAQKDLDGAITAYRKAIQLNPAKAMSAYRLGNVLSQQKQWTEACQVYQQALRTDPKLSKAFDGLVQALEARQAWDELFKLYQQHLGENQDSAKLQYGFGKILAKTGDYEAAEKHYQAALKLDPDLTAVYQDLRYVLEKLGKSQEATKMDREVVYSNAFSPKALCQPEDEGLNLQISQDDFQSSFQEFSELSILNSTSLQLMTWDDKTGRRLTMTETYQRLNSINRKSQPKVDIIVCVYNALEDVKICLNSIIRETTQFRLIIIDDCSESDTENFLKDFVRRFPEHLLVRNSTNLGYTKSANNGLLLSTSPYAVLLNSDVIVTPNWLEKMIECFESDPEIGVAGPLSNCASWQSVPELFGDKGDWKVNLLPENYNLVQFSELVEKLSYRGFPKVDLINGFCYMIRQDVLNEIGFLDEANFPYGYGEENDFSLRVGQAGFKLAIADHVYLYHSKSKSFGHSRRKELGRQGKEALGRKYPGLCFRTLTDKIRYSDDLIQLREKLNQVLAKPLIPQA